MFKYENYKKNLHIADEHGIKNVDVNKSTSYAAHIGVLKKGGKFNESENELIQPLAAAILGINNTGAPLPENTEFFTPHSYVDAQELLLTSKPTCYLILGKPGSGAYALGEAIAKHLNCIHLCPRTILKDEIAQKSSTGKCVDFNMKEDKAITFDTLFKMLKIKLDSDVIQHRGYIISGFPLITCDRNPQYLISSLNGEEGVLIVGEILLDIIANLKKKKKKLRLSAHSPTTSITSATDVAGENYEEEEEEQEEETPEEEEVIKVELPKFLLDTCSDLIHPTRAYYSTKKIVLLQQLNDLFNLKLKPDIIIYLTCPDKDLVTMKTRKYINYKTHQETVEPFMPKTPVEIRWPVKYTTSDFTCPTNTHLFKPKYFVRQPNNFTEKSVEQMCNYKNEVLPFIENKLKDFDPKFVFKVDGRLSRDEKMHEITQRLMMVHTNQVIIPKPLHMEETPEDLEEFWTSVGELNINPSGLVTFNRSASPWFNRCPVELKKRLSVKGNPMLAISFLKHIYLTATLDNFISFYKNPRPYLKLKYLEPTCRIIVVGTKLSGKTMISECLSWLFDAQVVNYNEVFQAEETKKYDVYAKTVLSEIIATIEDMRLEKWHNEEMERLANMERWCKSTLASLKKYVPFLRKYLSMENKIGNETEDAAFIKTFDKIRSTISFLPFLDDLYQCQNIVSVEEIKKYAPKELGMPNEKPKLPVLGDKDVTEAIAAYVEANELQKEMYPTTEELINTITNIITSIDAEHQQHTNMDEMYGKYIIDGFPSDTEFWNLLEESNLLPDCTIALIENRELEPELIQHYKIINDCLKNYHERYIHANDPIIKTKLKISTPPSMPDLDMKIILNDYIVQSSSDKNGTDIAAETAENIPETEEPWVSFGETIEKFKEEWDSVKIKLEENNKCFIEVQLENKTDIEIVEEVMLKLRKCYYLSCEINEDEEFEEEDDEEEATPKDMFTYNNPLNVGEIGIYCPISYYNYGVIWEGKPEFSVKFDNKLYRLSKEENLELFQNDVTKYQAYNKPFKTLPQLRICIIGAIGSGKTTVSKLIAKELGLIHIDFSEVINTMLLPRHFKKVGRQYENSFTDVPLDDEAVVEFQIDEANENLISDIMSNETELRRMVHNYFERGSQILPQLMQKLITKLWFEDPFVNTGFVLDGYPKLPTDLEDMTACYCIPDLIIELEGSSESTLERLSSKMFKTWKMQQNEAKEKARKNIEKEKQEWMEFLTKNIVAKLIVDEILENMYFSSEPPKGLSAESVLIDADPSASVMNTNLLNAYNEMIQVFPEPVDQSEWEKADEVRERIDGRLEGIFESDDENIQALKDVLIEQRIKTVSIDGNKSLTKVTRLALSKLTNLRNRNESFFEETYIFSPDIAETLLSEGLCFLNNKFKMMCPVYIFENPSAIINLYSVSKQKDEVFPVVHRSYVYYICGKDSLKKFRENPLKYVSANSICNFKEYPLRISVIGTPKSGRSTIAAKLAKRYGLICISRGIAVRDFLNNKYWTALGSQIVSTVTKGECLTPGQLMKAVRTIAMDHRSITNGFVFDGFPKMAAEALELYKDGIYPNIVFDVSADIAYTAENSQKEIYYDVLKRCPPYSRAYIENRYKTWVKNICFVRTWIETDFQNLYTLDGNKSKWKCIEQAVDIVNDFISKVHTYLTKVDTDIVPVDFLCISNEEFEHRISPFQHMCPICYRKRILTHNGNPVVKKGIAQYKNKFYWICPEHTDIVMKNPGKYLEATKLELPELPLRVKRVNMALVYEKGICIVTYAEHLPNQKLVVGTNEYACSYSGNRYLFCSKACHEKFLAKPHLYYDVTVFRAAKVSKPLTLKNLPIIGYLEQTVGIIITEACVSVTVDRPKYPGLTFQLSALLQIALYMKTHNCRMKQEELEMYKKASKVFEARCKLLTHVGLFLRSMDNPFANYPKCCGHTHGETESRSTSSRRSLTTSE